MKKTIPAILLVVYSLLLVCFVNCKKDNPIPPDPRFSIKLSDKPLDTIKKYIQGKWKLEYGYGGLSGRDSFHSPNTYYNFNGDRISISINSVVYTDTTINWTKGLGVFVDTDSTYVMDFFDKRGVPEVYVVDGIVKDSLKIHEYSSDTYFYHFSKSN